MTGTTTIEITNEQKERLANRKQHDREAYKSVVGRLLDGEPESAADVDGLTEEIKDQLSMHADPGVVVTDEDVERLMSRLDELEHGIKNEIEALQGGRI